MGTESQSGSDTNAICGNFHGIPEGIINEVNWWNTEDKKEEKNLFKQHTMYGIPGDIDDNSSSNDD